MRKSILLTLLLIIAANFCLMAQKSITGKITDSKTGKPIGSATIIILGTSLGTATSADGTFALSTPANAKQLEISAIGFKSSVVEINGINLDIKLESSTTKILDEVIVVGYGTKIKKDLTGNIAKVKGADVQNMPVTNLNQALQGRAAGVFVESNNGKVGEGVKVLIRGSGSILASNSPLYVIDGIPISNNSYSGNPIADINFNDVESFDILKDASAAAIYGSRAANGVVLITTKKEKQEKQPFK
jgi:TonB-dependent SusC/RagA subfamily outer membrane receptor